MTACDPLTREECCDQGACAACPAEGRSGAAHLVTFSATEPTDPQTGDRWFDARGWLWKYDADDMGGGWTYRSQPSAPPLSPTEQATVDRFEAAPDPWEER